MEEAISVVKGLIDLEVERRIFKDQFRTRSMLINPLAMTVSYHQTRLYLRSATVFYISVRSRAVTQVDLQLNIVDI